MKASIIIPSYNEIENLPILINEINQNLKSYSNYEIIIVDDCSNDNTKVFFEDNKFTNLKYKKNNINIGQSFSIIEGVKIAQYNIIITLDADLQNNPKDILKLFKAYQNNIDVKLIGGIRKNRKDSFFKILSSKVANFVRNFILKDECTDTGCSLKIFDKKIFLQFPKFNGIHRFLPALFKGFGYSTMFVNVDHRPRINGISKYGTINRMLKGIKDLIKVALIIKKFKRNNVELFSKFK